jgi:hypothetical protein
VIGVAEMFAEFSQPDEFHAQAQLELFAWQRSVSRREWDEKYARKLKLDHARIEKRRARQRAWARSKRKCGHHSCSRPCADGRSRCEHHLALNAKHQRLVTERRRAA